MTPTKQTVYLPVGEFNNSERCICTIGIPDLYGDKVVEQEVFVFTPEQLNEYTQKVIKQALETAAEKVRMYDTNEDCHFEDENGHFPEIYALDRQSITNTFEETYKKFEV